MGHMDEDRVYADRLGKTDVFVATGMGVAVVSVSNDRIGQFSLAHRCTALDVAAADGDLLIATDEDVLHATDDAETAEPTGFGPAVAVGARERVAAAPDGTVARLVDGEWEPLGELADVRAIDGDLLAAAEGVHRVETDLPHVGLSDAVDVSTAGVPLAATDDGCYRLGPGWTRDLDGAFAFVASDGDRAHAGTTATLYERTGGEWHEHDAPTDEPLVDVGYVADGGVVAVTAEGTMLVDPAAAKDGAMGWRSRSLGLPDVRAVAVPTDAF